VAAKDIAVNTSINIKTSRIAKNCFFNVNLSFAADIIESYIRTGLFILI